MFNEASYQHALDFLYSFVDYSLTRAFRFTPEKFNLDRMRALLDRLGNPQEAYPVIHVAGTKGKGSVSALCASALQAAGYRTGLYTSPHLQEYVERIQLNGEPMSHADLVALIDEIRPLTQEIPELTTFELTTAIGFLYFARQHADVAVIEVGLGGRLDATNVVDPTVSLITTLSYDHMAVLGDTLTQIAGEKAGIIKPGRPVISAPQKEEALKVIEQVAAEKNSPLTLIGSDYQFSPPSRSLSGQTLYVWKASDQEKMDAFIESDGMGKWVPTRLITPLLGYHQLENAATAYAALQVVKECCGLKIEEEDIHRGFETVSWPCRFEVLRRDPPLVVDSAHNPDSALKLRLALDDYFPTRPVVLLFGASEDKDVRGILRELLPRVCQVIATQSDHPRAMEAGKIVEMAHQFGCKAKAVLPIESALQEALRVADADDAVVATGSLFVAAAARHVFLNPVPEP